MEKILKMVESTITKKNTTKKSGPALYVGTYEKYNNGSIYGAWLQLEDYADAEEFHKACAALHSDESDPEYMFQDYEHLPEFLYSESGNVDLIYEWLSYDTMERGAIEAWLNDICFEPSDRWQNIIDSHHGVWDSEEDFAWHIVEECGGFNDIPQHLQCYFDCGSYARDLFINDFNSAYYNAGNMHVFSNH